MSTYQACRHCGAEIEIPIGYAGTPLNCPLCETPNQPPPMRFAPGTLLGGYRIVDRTEAEGAHETYRAERAPGLPLVKLQTFMPTEFDRGEPADYFLMAMKAWLAVKQPNIPRIIDAGRSSTGAYFAVHGQLDGMTLEERLSRAGGMELTSALHMATSIAQILRWLWTEHGLIYGALSPRQIILTPAKDVFLAPMALAPVLRNRPSGLPLGELVMGMPGFTSPELLNASESVDCRSDMYSLGATLYHMLTGKPPFACLDPYEVRTRLQAPSLPDPRTLCADLPDEVLWLLEALLAHDPNDRFPDWDYLVEMLVALELRQAVIPTRNMKSHSVLIRLSPDELADLTHGLPGATPNRRVIKRLK